MAVEKNLNGQKVPIPLVIEKANERSPESIAEQIAQAHKAELTEKDIVLQQKAGRMERMYYALPGFVRRYVWKYLLRHPISIHPICFGASSIVKKPSVVDDKIVIREILHMSILLDHDVMDGADMARFISYLVKNVESGMNL